MLLQSNLLSYIQNNADMFMTDEAWQALQTRYTSGGDSAQISTNTVNGSRPLWDYLRMLSVYLAQQQLMGLTTFNEQGVLVSAKPTEWNFDTWKWLYDKNFAPGKGFESPGFEAWLDAQFALIGAKCTSCGNGNIFAVTQELQMAIQTYLIEKYVPLQQYREAYTKHPFIEELKQYGVGVELLKQNSNWSWLLGEQGKKLT